MYCNRWFIVTICSRNNEELLPGIWFLPFKTFNICRLAKFDKSALKKKAGFRDNLKSTGQSKFALEEKEEVYINLYY